MDHNKTCFVTAFLDIGRDNWNYFKRSFDVYLDSFKHLASLFSCQEGNLLVAFVDSTKYEKIVKEVTIASNVILIPIDETFLQAHSPLWRRLYREGEIMQSTTFANFIAHRKNCPECHEPKYTLINHAKIDFIEMAIGRYPSYDSFAWIDFGYFQPGIERPRTLMNLEPLDKNKIHYTLINPITVNDQNIFYTLLYAPERIGGFFFYGGKQALLEYRTLYHQVHEALQLGNIVDDDQHVALRCTFVKPALFQLHLAGGWHRIFGLFS